MKAVLALDPGICRRATGSTSCIRRSGGGAKDRSTGSRIAARDPLHAGYQFKLVYAYWILGRIGEADRTADRALHLWPRHPGVWLARLWTLAFTGRPERALAHVDDVAGQARPSRRR